MFCLKTPLAFFFIDYPGGHNHVQMGMIFKFTIMGMQDGMSSDPSLELWITAEGWFAGAASGEPSDDEKRLGRGVGRLLTWTTPTVSHSCRRASHMNRRPRCRT
jgi:hypothetical protein